MGLHLAVCAHVSNSTTKQIFVKHDDTLIQHISAAIRITGQKWRFY
jgi:hypothetical protein